MAYISNHLDNAKSSYFAHMKTGSGMIFYSLLVFITSTIHAILPFAFEQTSAKVARKLSSLVDETFEHHK